MFLASFFIFKVVGVCFLSFGLCLIFFCFFMFLLLVVVLWLNNVFSLLCKILLYMLLAFSGGLFWI